MFQTTNQTWFYPHYCNDQRDRQNFAVESRSNVDQCRVCPWVFHLVNVWVQPDAETKRTWLVMTQTLKPGPGLVRCFTVSTLKSGKN